VWTVGQGGQKSIILSTVDSEQAGRIYVIWSFSALLVTAKPIAMRQRRGTCTICKISMNTIMSPWASLGSDC